MAPVLGRKLYPLVNMLTEPLKPGDEIYTIEHSKESFRDKEEYEARLQLYGKPIWTCKSTGSSKLTHKEAWDQEQKISKLLQQKFQSCFEKPVLEIIHHNTHALEQLVDEVYRELMTKYVLDEECNFEDANGKLMQVKIVKVYPPEKANQESPEKKAESACDASSSDKVQSNQMIPDNYIKEPSKKEESGYIAIQGECVSEQALHSPQKHLTSLKKEEKKWALTKFLPPKYDIKPKNEDNLISSVPAKSLHRLESPPNKEIVRCFIRHYALRIGKGENAYWVVEDELVKKYALPSKYSDFLQDPDKYLTLNPPAGILPKNRKKCVSPGKKPLSSIKGKKEEEKNIEVKKQKKTSKTVPLNLTISSHEHLNKSTITTQLKTNSRDSSNSPSQDVISVSCTYKLDSFQIPNKFILPEVLPRKKKIKVQKAKDLNGQMSGKQKTPMKELKNPKTKKTTIMDMSNSSPKMSRPPTSTTVTPDTSRKHQEDASSIVLHLVAFYRDNKDHEGRKAYLSSLITKATRLLSNNDRALLPEDLRVLVEKRYEKIEQKQKFASMTEEQRNEVLRERHNEQKEKMREKAKQRREKEIKEKVAKQRRYEDQELAGKSLPTFKLVYTPQELPNTLFGDVTMVVEFLNCYSQLLMPDEKYPVNAATLMEALTLGSGGFLYLNHMLMTLLHTLLQDKIAKDYVDLGMKVSDIPLTLHSVSELVRLGLLNSETEESYEDSSQGYNGEDSKDSACFENSEMENELLQKLETSEYFDLTVEEKLNIMVSLCHRNLSTHYVHDHVEEEQQRSAKLSKEHQAMKKVGTNEANKKEAKDKELKSEVSNKEVEVDRANSEFKKKEGEEIETKANAKTDDQIDLDAQDMISAVKRRRFLSMQANIEKAEKDRQQKEKLEKEAEEERVEKRRVKLEKAFHESIAKAKLVLRRSPIGMDRNHNRYWLFSDNVPGLFIETGWIHDSINYTSSLSPKEFNRGECDQDPEDNFQMDGETGTVATAEGSAATETTLPEQGDNLWFICGTQNELDELLDCLHPQGVRESELKECLYKRYQDIVHSIHLAHKPNPILKHCDGQQELLYHLRIYIIKVAKRLYKAGLGYLDETAKFEARVNSLDNLKELGDCLITLQESVGERFLQGFMAPKQTSHPEDSIVKTQKVNGKNRMIEEANVSSDVEKWKGAVHSAKTFSRMHVLLGMLDVCIKWNMSSANARCKVCSRKREDDQLILCDKCNKAFHLFCLRPVLYQVPDGEWLCPACQPSTLSCRSRGRNYAEDSTEEEGEGDEEYSEDEDDNDYEVEEVEDEEDDYPHLMELQVGSRKADKAQKCRASTVECKYLPPMKKSKNVAVEGSQQFTPPINRSDVNEIVNQNKGTQPQNPELQHCQNILNKLIEYEFSWPFRELLIFEQSEDCKGIDINPMDFMIMLSKCTCNMYHTVGEFLEDIKVVFYNAELYSHNRNHMNTCLENTENYLLAMLRKHLPGHTYQRIKQRKRPAKRVAPLDDKADAEANDSVTADHFIGKKKKK